MTLRVIAIDGPAASGKSSTAALVAKGLGWAHLDSGALYRALTLAALDNIGAELSAQRILALAEEMPVRLVLVGDVFRPEVAGVDVKDAIRGERVTRHVSAVAAIPEVRAWVNARQREAAAQHPSGVVVDGRDIGTVVFPRADVKIYLDASAEERARRRAADPAHSGGPSAIADVATALSARDEIDRTRKASPLVVAADAIQFDTTGKSVMDVVEEVMVVIRGKLEGKS